MKSNFYFEMLQFDLTCFLIDQFTAKPETAASAGVFPMKMLLQWTETSFCPNECQSNRIQLGLFSKRPYLFDLEPPLLLLVGCAGRSEHTCQQDPACFDPWTLRNMWKSWFNWERCERQFEQVRFQVNEILNIRVEHNVLETKRKNIFSGENYTSFFLCVFVFVLVGQDGSYFGRHFLSCLKIFKKQMQMMAKRDCGSANYAPLKNFP